MQLRAFWFFLLQKYAAFGTFCSVDSVRFFPRVGHGVGQAKSRSKRWADTGQGQTGCPDPSGSALSVLSLLPLPLHYPSAMPLSIRQSNFAHRQLRQAQIGKLQIHISSLAQNRLVVSRCAPGRQVSRTSPTQITPVFQLLTESGVEIRLAWMAPLKNLISCFLTP